jgi:hypothetical protein
MRNGRPVAFGIGRIAVRLKRPQEKPGRCVKKKKRVWFVE